MPRGRHAGGIRRAYRAAADGSTPTSPGRPDAAERMHLLDDAFRRARRREDPGRLDHGASRRRAGGQAQPWTVGSRTRCDRARRRAVRLLAVLLLLAGAAAAVAALFVYEERVRGHLPYSVAAAPPLEEVVGRAARHVLGPVGRAARVHRGRGGMRPVAGVRRPRGTSGGDAARCGAARPDGPPGQRRAPAGGRAHGAAGGGTPAEAFVDVVALIGTQEASLRGRAAVARPRRRAPARRGAAPPPLRRLRRHGQDAPRGARARRAGVPGGAAGRRAARPPRHGLRAGPGQQLRPALALREVGVLVGVGRGAAAEEAQRVAVPVARIRCHAPGGIAMASPGSTSAASPSTSITPVPSRMK